MRTNLLTVDLQSDYKHWIAHWDVEQVSSYITKRYREVYNMYDETNLLRDECAPLFEFQQNASLSCWKRYDTFMYDIPLEDRYILIDPLNASYHIHDVKEKKQLLKRLKIGDIFYVIEMPFDSRHAVMKVNSLHKFVELTQEMASFISKLPTKIDIIGGGYKECLHDVYYMLKYLGKDVRIIKEFVY